MSDTGESAIEGVAVDDMRTYLDGTDVDFAVLFGSHARGTAGQDSDVDVAVQFPDALAEAERFRRRNRIDAELQRYSEAFVDVSDIDELPNAVAYAALRDGILLTGDERAAKRYQTRVEREYEAAAADRERERSEFIDRLASGDV